LAGFGRNSAKDRKRSLGERLKLGSPQRHEGRKLRMKDEKMRDKNPQAGKLKVLNRR
jgi:hypothetical protein